MSHTTQDNRAKSDAFARFNDWDADLSTPGTRTPNSSGPQVTGTVKPEGATYRSSNVADSVDTSRAQNQASAGDSSELRGSGFGRNSGNMRPEETGPVGSGESSWGVGRSHATGDSIVPEGLQKILPESIERAVPDSIHDTSIKSSSK